MLNCELCSLNNPHLTFTRCCKALICPSCSEKLDKKLTCFCGRPLSQGRKNYTDYPEIMTILRNFSTQKDKQCDRCDRIAEYQCTECDMAYCQMCNGQVHAGIGFAKHTRKTMTQLKANLEKLKKTQAICLQHNQSIIAGCDCGATLCQQCSKQHKDSCSRGSRVKPLKQFKEDYFINVLLKLRQLAFFKEKLQQDSKKYQDHFQIQKSSFEETSGLVEEQFDYLKKMIQVKHSEITTKLTQYWENCQEVYDSTCRRMKEQQKKYDAYGQLLYKFSENLTNLDYFDKKIRRFNVNFEVANIRGTNFQHAQAALMNVAVIDKQWENNVFDTFLEKQSQENKAVSKDEARLLGNFQNTSELIMDYTNNPTKDRQLSLLASHAEVHFSFIHLPYQNVKYELEYGLGMKIKGQQMFNRISNTSGFGCIQGLNPNTKYRVRMRVSEGEWGPISEITTLDIPKFNSQASSCAKQSNDGTVQLGKGGLIYGSNEIHFGTHRWVIKLTSKSISYEGIETSCMSVGVSNKQTKKATFAGTTFNYGYQKSQIVLKVLLDCSEKRLIINNLTTGQQEVYQNLPNFPLFPTLQNKGNSQILVKYNLTSDELAAF